MYHGVFSHQSQKNAIRFGGKWQISTLCMPRNGHGNALADQHTFRAIRAQDRALGTAQNATFGREVFLVAPMPIQMVWREIGDHRHVGGRSTHQLKAGKLYHGKIRRTQRMQVREQRRTVVPPAANAFPLRAQDRLDQMRGGGFAIAARHADHGCRRMRQKPIRLARQIGTTRKRAQNSGVIRADPGGTKKHTFREFLGKTSHKTHTVCHVTAFHILIDRALVIHGGGTIHREKIVTHRTPRTTKAKHSDGIATKHTFG